MTGSIGEMLGHVFTANALVTAFAVVGLVMWLSNALSKHLTRGRVHGSAIAIIIGLAAAFAGGVWTGGEKGVADIPVLAGIGLMGGAMLRGLFNPMKRATSGVPIMTSTALSTPVAIDSAMTAELAPSAAPVTGPTMYVTAPAPMVVIETASV